MYIFNIFYFHFVQYEVRVTIVSIRYLGISANFSALAVYGLLCLLTYKQLVLHIDRYVPQSFHECFVKTKQNLGRKPYHPIVVKMRFWKSLVVLQQQESTMRQPDKRPFVRTRYRLYMP